MGNWFFFHRRRDRDASHEDAHPADSAMANLSLTAMGRLEIHQGDVGTTFLAEVEDEGRSVDVSHAGILIVFQKPDSSLVVRPGEFVTDGVDGQVRYVTQGGDLDQSGEWRLQVRLEFADLTRFSSDWKQFTVHPNLQQS